MSHRLFGSLLRRSLALAAATAFLVGCQSSEIPKHLKPIPAALAAKIQDLGMRDTAPIFVRIFKEESQLEVWKQRRDGQYALLKTYEICAWSGELGPKIREGDRQAPEGFYTVTPAQMNPNSSYYLSFNIGYPNAYDQSLGRTGAHLMVHGACSSAGCYSMTDESAGEIFSLAREAFKGGQRSFQVQAFPFRMTAENMARHNDNPNMPFWRMLKTGYDHFEVTRRPPKIDVCEHRYVFDAEAGTARFDAAAACPAYQVPAPIQQAVAAKAAEDEQRFQVAVARMQRDAGPDENDATMLAWSPARDDAPATPRAVAAPVVPAAVETTRVAAATAEPAERQRRGFFRRLVDRGTDLVTPAEAAPQVADVPVPRRAQRVATTAPSRNADGVGRIRAPEASERAFVAPSISDRLDNAFADFVTGSADTLPSSVSAWAAEQRR